MSVSRPGSSTTTVNLDRERTVVRATVVTEHSHDKHVAIASRRTPARPSAGETVTVGGLSFVVDEFTQMNGGDCDSKSPTVLGAFGTR